MSGSANFVSGQGHMNGAGQVNGTVNGTMNGIVNGFGVPVPTSSPGGMSYASTSSSPSIWTPGSTNPPTPLNMPPRQQTNAHTALPLQGQVFTPDSMKEHRDKIEEHTARIAQVVWQNMQMGQRMMEILGDGMPMAHGPYTVLWSAVQHNKDGAIKTLAQMHQDNVAKLVMLNTQMVDMNFELMSIPYQVYPNYDTPGNPLPN